MSVLVVTQFNPYDLTNGQSLIINNFIRCNQNKTLDLLYFGEEDIQNKLPDNLYEIFNIKYKIYPLRIRILKKYIFGNIFDRSLNNKKGFCSELLSKYDRVVFFFDPYDSLINFFSGIKVKNKILHVTDSVFLFESTKSQSFIKFLKMIISRHVERQVLSLNYDSFIYVGERDARYAEKIKPKRKSRILCLPQGVDTDTFYLLDEKKINKKLKILYSGNFEYTPNVKGAFYIVNEILPNLVGNFEVKFAGKGADKIDFKSKDPRLSIIGYVDNIADEYLDSDLFLAPLYEGAGLQNKILQAISCGLVTISTPMVKESLSEIPNGLFIVNDSQQMINLINEFIGGKRSIYDYRDVLRQFALTKLGWKNRFEIISNL